MKPYTKPYVNPLHVDDPERDPLSVPADHLSPDSTASHRPAARLTVNKTTRPEAACLCRVPALVLLARSVTPAGHWVQA